MTKKLKTSILAAIGMLVIILDTRTALSGASQGLQLCILTVIPSLLPFFVLSILLTSALAGENISLLRPLGRLLGIPKGTESLFLVGMLGGYPAGAQCVSKAHRDGLLSKRDAENMLAFCNLAGPSFLFGIVGEKFATPFAPWLLWGIHILSALLVAILLPCRSTDATVLQPGTQFTLPQALHRSVRLMANVCGWIILFRIFIVFLDRWVMWLLPPELRVTISGILELSNGCCNLQQINSDGLRFIVCSGLLGFGGICVFMQTSSVAEGLSLKMYTLGKLMQALISIVLASLVQHYLFSSTAHINLPIFLWPIFAITGIITVKFLHKRQKKSSISQPIGV